MKYKNVSIYAKDTILHTFLKVCIAGEKQTVYITKCFKHIMK